MILLIPIDVDTRSNVTKVLEIKIPTAVNYSTFTEEVAEAIRLQTVMTIRIRFGWWADTTVGF